MAPRLATPWPTAFRFRPGQGRRVPVLEPRSVVGEPWPDQAGAESGLPEQRLLAPRLQSPRASHAFVRGPRSSSGLPAALLGLALVVPTGGCLYTDPINMPPTVTITSPLHVWHHQDAAFTAIATDPDGGAVRIAWAHTAGNCVGSNPLAQTPVADPATPYTVPASDTVGTFCVWVFATDHQGATTTQHRPVDPEDHPPVPDLQILRPDPISAGAFPLYTEMKLSAANSVDADGDPLAFGWKILPTAFALPAAAAATTSALAPCREDDPTSTATICFVPPAPGQYTIRVTVSSLPGAAPVWLDKTFLVATDQMPCLTDTTPPLTDPLVVSTGASPLSFQVNRVVDDGDPYPVEPGGGITSFSWFLGQDSAAPAGVGPVVPAASPVVYQQSATLPVFRVYPFMYRPGDRIRVRVEIHDRNPAPIDAVLAGCDDGAALCPPASMCYQRKTWTVVFK